MDILARLQTIQVKQKLELLEIITGFETNNKYEICDSNGQPFMIAEESTGCCSRFFCGKERAFTMDILDFAGRQAICLRREYTCNCFQCCSCFSCCQDLITVECPPGNVVGYVKQEGTCCTINFTVRYPNYETMFYLKGPNYCLCTCPGTVHTFNIMTPDQSVEIGRLMKVWSGFARELFTDADRFQLDVPPDMAVEAKALLIGAVFLVDFMFFEDNNKPKTSLF